MAARRGGSAPNSGPKFLARRQSTIGIGGKLALSSLYVLPVAYLSSSSSAQRSFLSSFAAQWSFFLEYCPKKYEASLPTILLLLNGHLDHAVLPLVGGQGGL